MGWLPAVGWIREERTALFILYRRNGVEKVAKLQRCFLDEAAWQQLALLLAPASHSQAQR